VLSNVHLTYARHPDSVHCPTDFGVWNAAADAEAGPASSSPMVCWWHSILSYSILVLCAYMHQSTAALVRYNADRHHCDMTLRLAPFRKKSLRTMQTQHLVACWPLTIRMSNIVHDHWMMLMTLLQVCHLHSNIKFEFQTMLKSFTIDMLHLQLRVSCTADSQSLA